MGAAQHGTTRGEHGSYEARSLLLRPGTSLALASGIMPINYSRLALEAFVGVVMGLALLGCVAIAMH